MCSRSKEVPRKQIAKLNIKLGIIGDNSVRTQTYLQRKPLPHEAEVPMSILD